MKRALILFVALFLANNVHALDVVLNLKQDASRCAKAAISADFEEITNCTHSRIIEIMGGRQEMVNVLKRITTQMNSNGFFLIDAKNNFPSETKIIGTWITAMVPQTITMKAPKGRYYQDSMLLAVSEDKGEHWVFIDLGTNTEKQLYSVFPELINNIVMPEKKEPIFVKN